MPNMNKSGEEVKMIELKPCKLLFHQINERKGCPAYDNGRCYKRQMNKVAKAMGDTVVYSCKIRKPVRKAMKEGK